MLKTQSSWLRLIALLQSNRFSLILVLGLSVLLLSAGLADVPLTEPDEGRYADISLAFMKSGDAVVLTSNGVPWHDKPPMLIWLTGLSFYLFGVGELSARLVPVISGFFGILLAMGVSRTLSKEESAVWMSGLLLLVSPLWLICSRVLLVDSLFSVFTAGSYFFILYGAGGFGASPRYLWKLLGSVLLGCAILTKGPAAVVLVGGAAGALAIFERNKSLAFKILEPIPWLLALVIAAPWFYQLWLVNPEGVKDFLFSENLQRFRAWNEHQQGYHYYIVTLAWGFLPGLLLLLSAAFSMYRGRESSKSSSYILRCLSWLKKTPTESGRGERALLMFVLVTTVIFTAASSKLQTYILPISPLLAAVLGSWLSRRSVAELRCGVYGIFAILLCLPVGLVVFANFGMESRSELVRVASAAVTPWVVVSSFGPVLLGCLAILCLMKDRVRGALGLGLTAFGAILLVGLPIVPRVANFRSPRSLAEKIESLGRPEEKVLAFGYNIRGLPYYLGRPVIQSMSTVEDMQAIYKKFRPDLNPSPEEVEALFLTREPILVVIYRGKRDRSKNWRFKLFFEMMAKAQNGEKSPVFRSHGSFGPYDLFELWPPEDFKNK